MYSDDWGWMQRYKRWMRRYRLGLFLTLIGLSLIRQLGAIQETADARHVDLSGSFYLGFLGALLLFIGGIVLLVRAYRRARLQRTTAVGQRVCRVCGAVEPSQRFELGGGWACSSCGSGDFSLLKAEPHSRV
jgi:hypothetical protein